MKKNFYHIDDGLLVKYLLAECTHLEILKVEQWIAADPGNKALYDDFKLLWEKSKEITDSSDINEENAWQRFRSRTFTNPNEKARKKSGNIFILLKIAAMVVIITGTAWLGYTIFGNKKIQTIALYSRDNVITDTFPDGSIITLNKNSMVSYPERFNNNTRSIALKGEAFFTITPDKNKPFTIQVNDVSIRVVGTAFNVKNNNGNTEVIVASGIVQVTRQHKTIELHPKEKVMVRKDNAALVKENEKGTLYNYYRTREFECDNTPLWKLVEILNQAYNTNITIEKRELRNLPLTTTFNNESLDNILEIIRQTFNISVTRTGDRILLH